MCGSQAIVLRTRTLPIWIGFQMVVATTITNPGRPGAPWGESGTGYPVSGHPFLDDWYCET